MGQEHSLPEGTLVLTGGYRWKPIETVKVGEMVIGWDRGSGFAKKNAKRHAHEGRQPKLLPRYVYALSGVTKTHSYESETVELVLASGKTLICTPDHLWLDHSLFGKFVNAPRRSG